MIPNNPTLVAQCMCRDKEQFPETLFIQKCIHLFNEQPLISIGLYPSNEVHVAHHFTPKEVNYLSASSSQHLYCHHPDMLGRNLLTGEGIGILNDGDTRGRVPRQYAGRYTRASRRRGSHCMTLAEGKSFI